jgi:two-component system KDP operon response regulator KdpE
MKARVLLIEDEVSIRRFLTPLLQEQGLDVREAANGEDGVREAIAFRPDLILLDLGLPDLSGEAVLAKLRGWSKVPVLILTASGEEAKKVEMLNAGADDYVTKPFSVVELIARIGVALRHTLEAKDGPVVHAGPLEIDLAAHIVRKNGVQVHLTGTEYEFIRMLARNAGRIVTQRRLLAEIWGPNSVEFTHYLRIYAAQLRKKLEEDPSDPKMILTEPGVGYRLVSD